MVSDLQWRELHHLSCSVGQVNLYTYISELRHSPATYPRAESKDRRRPSIKRRSLRKWPDRWIIHETQQPTFVDSVAKGFKRPYPRCPSTTQKRLDPDEFPRLYIALVTLWVLSASVPVTLGARSGPPLQIILSRPSRMLFATLNQLPLIDSVLTLVYSWASLCYSAMTVVVIPHFTNGLFWYCPIIFRTHSFASRSVENRARTRRPVR